MAPLRLSVAYTANPAPPSRKASPQFIELGATNMVPSEIGSVKFSIIPAAFSMAFLVMQTFWALVAALNNLAECVLNKNTTLSITEAVPFLFPRPALGVTLSSAGEDKIQKLEAAGFSKRLDGRRVYYSGPSTPEAIQTAVKVGCATDARVPSNTVNVDGAVALSVINRILYHSFRILCPQFTLPATVSKAYTATDADIGRAPWFTEVNLDTLPERGVFLSYFDGLLLPDRSFPINTLIKRFSNLFGDTPLRAEATAKTLSRGWASLHDTSSGRAISHAIFCIDLALSSGLRLTPVFLNGDYSGCVLEGKTFMIVQTSGTYIPGDKDGMKAAIELMSSHDAALTAIADLLSGLTIRDSGKTETVTVSQLSTPRQIHNFTRVRKVDSQAQTNLMALVRKLRFRQTMWDVTNSKHVLAATKAIMTKEFLGGDVPCNIASDGLWSQNPIYSTLLAFGARAPTLRGFGSGMARRIATDMYSAVQKPGKLLGVPVFFKSPRQALEDWEDVLTSHQVWWNHNGKDKEGKLAVSGIGSLIPFGDEANGIVKALTAYSAQSKRKREDEPAREPTEKQKEESNRSKRARVDAYAGLFEGLGPTSGEAMEEDGDFYA